VDRSQHVSHALDELRLIQSEARSSESLSRLRGYFDRVHEIKRAHLDDFDVQVLTAEVQEEIIERARAVRATPYNEQLPASAQSPLAVTLRPDDAPEAAEIPPDIPRVDPHTWRRSVLLALFLTAVALAAFFYLIQTARRINLPSSQPETATAKPAANPAASKPPAATQPVSTTPIRPTLRLYTDLVPGTVSIDKGAPQDLTDGELVLDQLQPGPHSITVTGRSGTATFSFKIDSNSAPEITGAPLATNAIAVFLSEQGGKGRLVTTAQNSTLVLDGKPLGEIEPQGLSIDQLGTADHDLQVNLEKKRERFVWTYTPAPVLTAYVKSDPNAGTVVVMTQIDGVNILINDKPYRRQTEGGQIRIPLKVGEYAIRVHKDGFVDPPPQSVEVKKAEETAVNFSLEPTPALATLQLKGAAPGTKIYIDKELAGSVGVNGEASIATVKPGEHSIELEHDQATPKTSAHVFAAGKTVVLSGEDVTLEPVRAEPTPETAAPPESVPAPAPDPSVEMKGEQVRKGGGFVAYHTPKAPGHYTFEAHSHIGGILKHNKLQWYAGFVDSENYVLYTVDGKHAIVREIHDGKSLEINRVDFNADSNQWVQVDLSVKPNLISVRVKTPDGAWSDLGSVASQGGRDFTQGKVGFYIPGNEEVAIANFRFSSR